jgi:hypothetical protein
MQRPTIYRSDTWTSVPELSLQELATWVYKAAGVGRGGVVLAGCRAVDRTAGSVCICIVLQRGRRGREEWDLGEKTGAGEDIGESADGGHGDGDGKWGVMW